MNKVVMPKRAFILAAGFGTRLRPYTDHVPKPMVEVAGRSLIWRTLDKLREVGICEIVVNAHYLGDVLVQHMDEYQVQHKDVVIHISREDDILDTGGGVLHALDYFKDEAFYVIAGDNLWTDDDAQVGTLQRLAQHWDDTRMDILTLMQDVDAMVLTKGVGDYRFTDGKQGLNVARSLTREGTHMWTNIRLNHPRIYREYERAEKAFSFLPIMDDCQARGRLCALEHRGDWHHISTAQDLERVDAHFKGSDDV